MRFLGHQDLIACFSAPFVGRLCALIILAGFTLTRSSGFPAARSGVESVTEYLDFDLMDENSSVEQIACRLNASLPIGIKPLKIAEISLNDPAISGKIRQVIYEVTYFNAVSPEEAQQRVAAFESAESVVIRENPQGSSQKP